MRSIFSSRRRGEADARSVTRWVYLIPCVALVITHQRAGATPETFSFTGTVTSVDPLLARSFQVSQTLAGSYTFDSNLADSFPDDPSVGRYQPASFAFNVGEYVGSGTSGFIQVQTSPEQEYLFDAQPFNGAQVNGFPTSQFHLDLITFLQSPFQNDSLPLVPPNLANFETNLFFVRFEDVAQNRALDVRGTITSITLPEPATLAWIVVESGLMAQRRRVLKL